MIYIHVPYCHQRCTYCAFYSSPTRADRQPYVDALKRELVQRRGEQDHPISTIYFGGGTPSLLTIGQLSELTETLGECFDLSGLDEVTLEANPEDLTDEYLKQLAGLGFFNRISMGIQSFSDTDLRTLNRRHSGRQALEAVEAAHRHGFDNISVDLIYGLPGQSAIDFDRNLETLNAIEPLITHFSAYALTLEPGTMLDRQVRQGMHEAPNEETLLECYHAMRQWASSHGWRQYEISSYCKPGRESKHNSRYWNGTPYLGVGASAHSFDGTHRRWNLSDTTRYIDAPTPPFEQETLTPNDRMNEYLMTALRTTSGIDIGHVATHHSWALEPLKQRIRPYLGTLLEESDSHWIPTEQGLLQADGIAAEIFF